MRRLTQRAAQISCIGVDPRHLVPRGAHCTHKNRAKLREEVQFSLKALDGLRTRPQQLQGPVEVHRSFRNGGALGGELSGAVPVVNRLFCHAPYVAMPCKYFRLNLDRLRKVLLQRADDPGVQQFAL